MCLFLYTRASGRVAAAENVGTWYWTAMTTETTETTTTPTSTAALQHERMRAFAAVAVFMFLGRVYEGFFSSLFLFLLGYQVGKTNPSAFGAAAAHGAEIVHSLCAMGLSDIHALLRGDRHASPPKEE